MLSATLAACPGRRHKCTLHRNKKVKVANAVKLSKVSMRLPFALFSRRTFPLCLPRCAASLLKCLLSRAAMHRFPSFPCSLSVVFRKRLHVCSQANAPELGRTSLAPTASTSESYVMLPCVVHTHTQTRALCHSRCD